jgi:uncharacterized protein (DUF1697 family)
MKYVALLRGINVGGNNKVEMSKLKLTFETIGCSNVSTYINSGNVIFDDVRYAKLLVEIIEKQLLLDFGLQLKVIVRDQANIQYLCAQIPATWTNDAINKTDVYFLWDEIDNPDILSKVAIDPEYENVSRYPGSLVWRAVKSHIEPGATIRFLDKSYHKKVTVRNINTLRRLNDIMQNSGQVYRSAVELITPKMEAILDEAEEDIERGNVSESFCSAEQATNYLNKL